MIVDEPTAGLDPAERVRFLNLLSKLGENSVVLLSTHIVEDVSELCTKMAVIDEGEILLEAEPLRAVDDLHGRIWRRVISKVELPELEREHAVISTKLLAGRTVVHVYICRIGVVVLVCCAGVCSRGRRAGGLTRSYVRENQA